MTTRELRPPQNVATEPPRAAPRERERAKRDPVYEAALGARIRATRIATKMSQTTLGVAVGFTAQQMQRCETGKGSISVNILQGIAAALGVHPRSFFDESMPVPVGPISDLKASFKAAEVLGQIRDPRVLKQMLTLAQVLVEGEP